MKKAWIASITVLFTVSVLVFSSQAAYAGQTPEFAIKCYQLGQGNPPVAIGPVPFVDQFQNTMVDPDGDQRYCVEALKHSDTPPQNPRYWVEHEDANEAINDLLLNPNGITITDQFLGKFTANLFHFELLIPASVSGLVVGPVNTNYYSGYSPTVLQSTLQLPTTVMVSDQFATSMITLQMNSEFAFEATATVGGEGTPAVDLMCYMYENEDEVQITGNIDPNAAESASVWITQFTQVSPNMPVNVVDLDQADVLCVMATKMEPTPPTPPPVGGEFIPIDSAALMLAGLQTSAIWMLPVLAGVAGSAFGILYIKYRRN